jgi:prolyl-tRNA synthetase
MRYSNLCTKTKFEAPNAANSTNAKLLIQAGFVDQLAAGIYNYLPLGNRVLQKICQIIREEMDAIGGQEIYMPAMHPVEIWEQTGRSKSMDEILFRTNGSDKKQYILGPSHEETVVPLLKNYISSHKDLPASVYQIQSKFRNEARAKSGILRGREFGMKDMYSFHATEEDLDRYYEIVKEAYLRVFKRCGLKAYTVEASGGVFSEKPSHEFSVITPAGEDIIIISESTDCAQNVEVATGVLAAQARPEAEKEMQKVEVNRGLDIKENAKSHGVGEDQILKTVVYEVENAGLIGVCIRGDLQINETKLAKILRANVRLASGEKVKAAGLVTGFISPVNNEKIPFIADHSILSKKNFITGANEEAQDFVNVNIGRDFQIQEFHDLVEVNSIQFVCGETGGKLSEHKAVEVGNIFKLGSNFSDAFDLKYTAETGEKKSVIMGCYGIGTTRLMGTIVEASHDERGMIWPKSVAPYSVHLLHLGNDEEVIAKTEEIYQMLLDCNIEVLYDDRTESAGKKLADCDLIGIPLRIVISAKTLKESSAEFKERSKSETKLISLDNLIGKIHEYLA